ncbi:MAG: anti-sigma factor family protein [Acidimicrobiales bacterium]
MNIVPEPSENEVFAASEPFDGTEFPSSQPPFAGVDALGSGGPAPLFGAPAAHAADLSCIDVHRSLSFYLDGELAVHQSQAVQQHLGVCPPCQAAQAFQMQLRTTVASKALDPMPADVRSRITRALGFE